MTHNQLQHILTAIIHLEDKTPGSMHRDEYWATVALAQELQAPQFVTEYFAAKAIAAQE